MEYGDAIAEAEKFGEPGGDDQDGVPFGGQLMDRAVESKSGFQGEVLRRVVEKMKAGGLINGVFVNVSP